MSAELERLKSELNRSVDMYIEWLRAAEECNISDKTPLYKNFEELNKSMIELYEKGEM